MASTKFEHLRRTERNIVWKYGGIWLTPCQVFTREMVGVLKFFAYLTLTECKGHLNDQFIFLNKFYAFYPC